MRLSHKASWVATIVGADNDEAALDLHRGNILRQLNGGSLAAEVGNLTRWHH